MNWDAWLVIVEGILGVGQLAITLWLYRVAAMAARVEGLEQSLKQTAGQLVDAKFSAVAERLDNGMARFEETVARIEKRLEKGDETFGSLGERNHELDKKIGSAKAEVREWALERFASVAELHELRGAVHQIRTELAGCRATCGQR